MGKTIDDEILDELLKGCERPEDLLGGGGLLKEFKTALVQRMLGAELSDHPGYEHGSEAPPVQTNRRNGASRKTVKGEDGAFEIEVPRDRDGSFGPKLIAKGQTRIVQRLEQAHPQKARREGPVGNMLLCQPVAVILQILCRHVAPDRQKPVSPRHFAPPNSAARATFKSMS